MPFPPSNHLVFERNTLKQVICQLRFKTVLEIAAQLPARFQGFVREAFPTFEEKLPLADELPGLPAELQKLINANRRPGDVSYEFRSEDAKWTLSLNKDFLALTCTEYHNYRDFAARFTGPVKALIDCYDPKDFTRVGMRYVNAIVPSEIGLAGVPVTELVHPHIAGELADEVVGPSVRQTMRQTEFRIDEIDADVRLRHGLVSVESPTGPTEPCYVLDADFYRMGKTGVEDVDALLENFNRFAGRLFYWSVTDRLRAALNPIVKGA